MPCGRPTASGGTCGHKTTKRPPDCGRHGPASDVLLATSLGSVAPGLGRERPPEVVLPDIGPVDRYAIYNDDGNLVGYDTHLDDAINGVGVCVGAGSVVDTETQEEVWRSTAAEEAAFVPADRSGRGRSLRRRHRTAYP